MVLCALCSCGRAAAITPLRHVLGAVQYVIECDRPPFASRPVKFGCSITQQIAVLVSSQRHPLDSVDTGFLALTDRPVPLPLLPVIVPILYTAAIMPFEVFFITDSSTVWLAIEIALTVAFGIDMLLCFNLAYHDRHGHVISSRFDATPRAVQISCRVRAGVVLT